MNNTNRKPLVIASIDKLKLPTISEQGRKALDVINAKDCDFKKLEAALATDPMLAGIVLKYANSPMYRAYVETTSVRQAVNLLGLDIVKSAILICTMRVFLEPSNPAKEMLWEKSMNLSVMAKLLAGKVSRKLVNAAETTAMMSEIGGLVLSANFPDEYGDVISRAMDKRISLEDEEMYTFGLKRAEITEMTLKKLRLPQVTIDILKRYHNSDIPDSVSSDVDKQLVIIELAYFFIAYKSKPELIKADNKCQSLIKRLGLEKMNVDLILKLYQKDIAEGFAF